MNFVGMLAPILLGLLLKIFTQKTNKYLSIIKTRKFRTHFKQTLQIVHNVQKTIKREKGFKKILKWYYEIIFCCHILSYLPSRFSGQGNTFLNYKQSDLNYNQSMIIMILLVLYYLLYTIYITYMYCKLPIRNIKKNSNFFFKFLNHRLINSLNIFFELLKLNNTIYILKNHYYKTI